MDVMNSTGPAWFWAVMLIALAVIAFLARPAQPPR